MGNVRNISPWSAEIGALRLSLSIANTRIAAGLAKVANLKLQSRTLKAEKREVRALLAKAQKEIKNLRAIVKKLENENRLLSRGFGARPSKNFGAVHGRS